MTLDPQSIARIAELDQLKAAFRSWAECLQAAQFELMKVGVPQETAYDTAREWLSLIVQSIGVKHD